MPRPFLPKLSATNCWYQLNKLEDFSDIGYWVNTACPRLEVPKMIALKDILGAAVLSTKHPKKRHR